MAQEFITQDERMTISGSGVPAHSEELNGAGLQPNSPENEALFPSGESAEFRRQWADIQTSFVDEPKPSVEKADQLVDSVIQELAEVFAAERSKLESTWSKGGEVSTEDLRQALRRYRSFFDRLLAV